MENPTDQAGFSRFAAIDIGTVTCRLLVAASDGISVCPLVRKSIITNLGEDVDATGVLKPSAMQRVFDAVNDYLDIIKGFEEPIHVIALATSAARDAQNAADFVSELAKRGVSLSVIPGEKEASLGFLGASLDFTGQPLIVTDIGGGSTEIIAGRAGQEPLYSHSFNIGCRRITDRFLHADPLNPTEVEASRQWIRQQFEPYFQQMNQAGFVPAQVVSVTGTATSVVSMRDRMEVYDSSRVHGALVTKHQLDQVFQELSKLSLDQRMHRVGLQPQRAGVINGGLIIQQEVLRAAHCNSFIASESDILQGIILTAARNQEMANADRCHP